MRILFLCTGNEFTSDMKYKENYLIQAAIENHDKVWVIAGTNTYVDGKKTYVQQGIYKEKGYSILRLENKRFINRKLSDKLRCTPNLKKHILKIKPDVLFYNCPQIWNVNDLKEVHGYLPNCLVIWDFTTWYGNSGRNWISLNILHKGIYRYWLEKNERYVDNIIYICNDTKKFIEEVYHLTKKLELMTLPAKVIEVEERKRRGQYIKRRYDIKEGQVVFCHSGKMDKIKKSLELIRIFSQITYQEFRFLIVGKFSEEITSEAMEIIYNDPRITFIPFVPAEELTDILCATDVYVQPASVSQTAETAICCGCPIIFENNTINSEIYNGNGFLIDNLSDIPKILENIHNKNINLDTLQQLSYKMAKEKMDYKMQYKKIIDMWFAKNGRAGIGKVYE